MPTLIKDKTYYKVRETAQAMEVTPQTVRAWIKQGKLQATKLGGLLITEESFKKILNMCLH